jgi:hypothetical protein
MAEDEEKGEKAPLGVTCNAGESFAHRNMLPRIP